MVAVLFYYLCFVMKVFRHILPILGLSLFPVALQAQTDLTFKFETAGVAGGGNHAPSGILPTVRVFRQQIPITHMPVSPRLAVCIGPLDSEWTTAWIWEAEPDLKATCLSISFMPMSTTGGWVCLWV